MERMSGNSREPENHSQADQECKKHSEDHKRHEDGGGGEAAAR
jgi:hypothetical protein